MMMNDMVLKTEDSLNADGDNSSNGDGIGDVCRDFLRNVCRRGNACRFRHPDPSEAEELGKKIEYIFCHDYQNRECHRQNCRFLHCTKQEEEVYRSTGKMPQHVLDKMAANKASEMAAANVPVCKDNLKGECRRGPGRCKFRHVSASEYENEVRGNNRAHNSRTDGHSSRGAIHNVFNDHGFDSFAPPEPKRRAYDAGGVFSSASNAFGGFAAERSGLGLNAITSAAHSLAEFAADFNASTQALQAATLPNNSLYSARYLEEENAALRRRIDELKKQVADLMATNEFLLEQNAQLRTIGKAGAAQSMAAQAAQAQTCAPNSLAQNQLPTLSSELLAQQRQNELTVGVSLGMQAQTISGLPTASIASMSLPTSVSQAVLSSSAPLVSYPIITTQAMRPAVMTHSLGH